MVTPNLVNGLHSLAMDSAGNFVVVWDDSVANRSGSTASVNAQRYDPSGRKLGSPITVTSSTTVNGWQSSVAMAPDGRFIVAWQYSVKHTQPDGSVYYELISNAQSYDGTGAAVGSPREIARTNSWEQPLAMAYDQAGNVTFAYTQIVSPHLGTGYPYDSGEVYYRRLTSAGVLQPESIANTTTQGRSSGRGSRPRPTAASSSRGRATGRATTPASYPNDSPPPRR